MGIFLKALYLRTPSITAIDNMFVRVLLIIPAYYGVAKKEKVNLFNIERKNQILLFFRCMTGPFVEVLYYMCLRYTPVGIQILIFNTIPIFVAIFAHFFLREKMSTTKVVCLGISIVGVYLVSMNSPDEEFADKYKYCPWIILF